jgi:ribonuclease VapC
VIVDSSALVEILRGQPQAERCMDVLRGERTLVMSAGNYLEACLVADNLVDRTAPQLLSQLIEQAGIDVIPVTAAQVEIARLAHQRYGKGEHNEPLLFVGNDFIHTDITPALAH